MLRIRIESGSEDVAAAQWDCALLVAAGSDPYALVDAAVAEAARLSGGLIHTCGVGYVILE